MKIHLNEARCEGYGFCAEKAPDLVSLDDEGDLIVLRENVEDSRLDAAQQAVRVCPVAALSLVEPA